MRFALIGPVYPYRGGIAHYTTLLNKVLIEECHEVLLVSFSRQYPHWLFPGASDRDPSQAPLHVEQAHYWLDSLNPFTWLATFARIRRFGPQVLVLQWWTSFWAPVWLTLALLNAWLLRAELAFVCHVALPHDAKFWDRWVTSLVLRWGRRILVQSEEERQVLLGLLPGAAITVVPHPVYAMFTEQQTTKPEARRRLQAPPEATVLLFFGIVRPYKGLEDIIEALPLVRHQVRELCLLVAGEFWIDKDALLGRIRQLDLAEIVRIDDRYIPNEEVGLYFSAADLVLAPYRGSGGGVIKLAAGFGLPVVTLAMLADQDDAAGATAGAARPTLIAAAISAALAQLDKPFSQSPKVDERPSWLELVHALEGRI